MRSREKDLQVLVRETVTKFKIAKKKMVKTNEEVIGGQCIRNYEGMLVVIDN